MKDTKELQCEVRIPEATKEEIEFNRRMLAEWFADDIIKYQRLGGDMDNLTAQNVYNLIDKGIPPKPINYKEEDFIEEHKADSDDKLLELYNSVKAELGDLMISYCHQKYKVKNKEFNKLPKDIKLKVLAKAYWFKAIK